MLDRYAIYQGGNRMKSILNKLMLFCSVLLFIGLNSCAHTSFVIMDESANYPPTQYVKLLEEEPDEDYIIIAKLETRGMVGSQIPDLLTNMRQKAKSLGADAIIPVQISKEYTNQGIIYNKWLGGYQTIGGGQVPIVTGYAIKFKANLKRQDTFNPYYNKRSNRQDFKSGLNVNLLPLSMNGIGYGIFVGKYYSRINFNYYRLDAPGAFFKDGFENGKIEEGLRLMYDYFYYGDLSGLYFSGGVQYTKLSVGHIDTDERGSWETYDISGGMGYLYYIMKNIHIDLNIGMDLKIANIESMYIGGYEMYPSPIGFFAGASLGLNF